MADECLHHRHQHCRPKIGILINTVDRMSKNVNDIKRDNAKVENDGHHGNCNKSNNNHGLICPHAGHTSQPTSQLASQHM